MVVGLGLTINADIQGQIEFYLFKLPNAVDILFDGWCIDQCRKHPKVFQSRHDQTSKTTNDRRPHQQMHPKDIYWPAMPRQGPWPQMQFKAGAGIEDPCQMWRITSLTTTHMSKECRRENIESSQCQDIKEHRCHPAKMMPKDTGCIDQWQRPNVQTKAEFNWWPANLVDAAPMQLIQCQCGWYSVNTVDTLPMWLIQSQYCWYNVNSVGTESIR